MVPPLAYAPTTLTDQQRAREIAEALFGQDNPEPLRELAITAFANRIAEALTAVREDERKQILRKKPV